MEESKGGCIQDGQEQLRPVPVRPPECFSRLIIPASVPVEDDDDLEIEDVSKIPTSRKISEIIPVDKEKNESFSAKIDQEVCQPDLVREQSDTKEVANPMSKTDDLRIYKVFSPSTSAILRNLGLTVQQICEMTSVELSQKIPKKRTTSAIARKLLERGLFLKDGEENTRKLANEVPSPWWAKFASEKNQEKLVENPQPQEPKKGNGKEIPEDLPHYYSPVDNMDDFGDKKISGEEKKADEAGIEFESNMGASDISGQKNSFSQNEEPIMKMVEELLLREFARIYGDDGFKIKSVKLEAKAHV